MENVKFIISSGYLKNKLKDANFRINPVEIISFQDEYMSLNCYNNIEISFIQIYPYQHEIKRFYQHKVRWDFLQKIINQIDEQPIIISVSEAELNIILSF